MGGGKGIVKGGKQKEKLEKTEKNIVRCHTNSPCRKINTVCQPQPL